MSFDAVFFLPETASLFMRQVAGVKPDVICDLLPSPLRSPSIFAALTPLAWICPALDPRSFQAGQVVFLQARHANFIGDRAE